jgi:Co/Zn/Cd efflux system component
VATASKVEPRPLVLLLGINAAMFVVELAAGWVAQSAGLIADSLDMLADAGVYAVALLAVGSTTRRKTHAAAVSGFIQLALAAGLAFEISRRAVSGSEPMSLLMTLISALALVANAACVVLLRKHLAAPRASRASAASAHETELSQRSSR